MRMRFKPYAHDELMAADFHVHEPLIWGGKWHAQYARPEQPFVLELGCGKGGFISQLACEAGGNFGIYGRAVTCGSFFQGK